MQDETDPLYWNAGEFTGVKLVYGGDQEYELYFDLPPVAFVTADGQPLDGLPVFVY